MILNKKVILRVSEMLGFNSVGNEQDWAFEFSDKYRIPEFIELFKVKELSEDEKVAIMSLILSSYEDLLYSQNDINNKIWLDIVSILKNNLGIYKDLLNYWALYNEKDSDNLFNITLLVRTVLAK